MSPHYMTGGKKKDGGKGRQLCTETGIVLNPDTCYVTHISSDEVFGRFDRIRVNMLTLHFVDEDAFRKWYKRAAAHVEADKKRHDDLNMPILKAKMEAHAARKIRMTSMKTIVCEDYIQLHPGATHREIADAVYAATTHPSKRIILAKNLIYYLMTTGRIEKFARGYKVKPPEEL